MKLDCLLAGVGGQGTVLVSKLLAQTALEHDYFVRTAETIGMAQRGGSVVSHVRIGNESGSPIIPLGHADLLIGFEPAEAVRNIAYLKDNATIVVNTCPVVPVTASLGENNYEVEKIIKYLETSGYNLVKLNGNLLCEQLGTAKAMNVIMLGAVLQTRLLPFDKQQLLAVLKKYLPAKFIALNEQALAIGYNYQQYQEVEDNE